MKKIYISFFCFVSFLLNAQTPMFQRTWGTSGNDYGFATLAVDSGYFLVCTIDYPNSNNSHVLIMRTNKFGDTLWTKKLNYPNVIVVARGVTPTLDGGILATIDSANYPRTYKIDSTGTIIWSKSLFTGGNLLATNDNGFVASMGNYIMKYDSSLNIQFYKSYAGANDHGLKSTIIQTTDSGYFLCGETRDLASGGFFDRDIYIARTDKNGTLLWDKTFGHSSGIDSPSDAIQTPDGGFLICGDIVGMGAGGTDILLIKTDASGNAQWIKTYGDISGDLGMFIKKVRGTTDYYIVARTPGMETNVFPGQKTALFRITANGNFIFGRLFCDQSDPFINELAVNSCFATPDGGILLCGHRSGPQDVWAVKTDNQGNSGCNELVISPTIMNHTLITTSGGVETSYTLTTAPAGYHDIGHQYPSETIICTNNIITSTNETPNTTNELLIYPNPATTQVTLQPQQPLKNANVWLYNTLGEVVMQYQNIKGEKITIATNELPAGIYFITVLDEDKTYTSKLIIE